MKTDPPDFLAWLSQMPRDWVAAFNRGRVSVRDKFADEDAANIDEAARHIRAAREIGANRQ